MSALLAQKLERRYGKGAPAAVDPQVLLQEIEAVTEADRLGGRRTQPFISQDFGRGDCKGQGRGDWVGKRGQGIMWLADDSSAPMSSTRLECL